MRAEDAVWVLRRDGEWRRGVVRAIGSVYVTVDVTGYVTADLCRADALEAMQALRAAIEAVAKARDRVVESAKAWRARLDAGDRWVGGGRIGLSGALDALHEAERAEAEVRARLETLR